MRNIYFLYSKILKKNAQNFELICNRYMNEYKLKTKLHRFLHLINKKVRNFVILQQMYAM